MGNRIDVCTPLKHCRVHGKSVPAEVSNKEVIDEDMASKGGPQNTAQ